MQRWDEDHDCKVCHDKGTLTLVIDGEDHTAFCSCEAGDEAYEHDSLVRDGWAA